MKRKTLFALLLMLALWASLWIPSFAEVIELPPPSLLDHADLLSEDEEALLDAWMGERSLTYDAHICIVTVNTTDGMGVDRYVNHLYDSMGFGFGKDHSGILLLVCMDEREFRILSNGAANDAIGDWEIEKISDAIVSDMSDGDYYAAFDEFVDQCDYYLDGHINGFPFRWGKNLVIALIIGLVAGLITAFSLKAQLKSVRKQHLADAYVKSGSMQVSTRSDLYLYRNVTRVRKQNNNSSGSRSGGSSRSVGGRSF